MLKYSFALFNAEKLNYSELKILTNELWLNMLALFLKNKFKDTRSVQELTSLIKEEYDLA